MLKKNDIVKRSLGWGFEKIGLCIQRKLEDV
jgi:hypothetical protein